MVGDPTLLSGGTMSRSRIELYGFGFSSGFGLPKCESEAGGNGGSGSGGTSATHRDETRRRETTGDDGRPVLGLIPDRDADASRKGARLHEAPRGEDCHSGPVEAPARGRLGECDQEQPGESTRGFGFGWNLRFPSIQVGKGKGKSVLTVKPSL